MSVKGDPYTQKGEVWKLVIGLFYRGKISQENPGPTCRKTGAWKHGIGYFYRGKCSQESCGPTCVPTKRFLGKPLNEGCVEGCDWLVLPTKCSSKNLGPTDILAVCYRCRICVYKYNSSLTFSSLYSHSIFFNITQILFSIILLSLLKFLTQVIIVIFL